MILVNTKNVPQHCHLSKTSLSKKESESGTLGIRTWDVQVYKQEYHHKPISTQNCEFCLQMNLKWSILFHNTFSEFHSFSMIVKNCSP